MLYCMKLHFQSRNKVKENKLIISKKEWKNYWKNKYLYLGLKKEIMFERIIFILLNGDLSNDNKKIQFEINNDNYSIKLLPEGYKYRYFKYKRWEYVQHSQIKVLTYCLIVIALLSFLKDINDTGIITFFKNLIK